ncbi:MAG: hypothetical protein ACK559_01875, partial [bacterium]
TGPCTQAGWPRYGQQLLGHLTLHRAPPLRGGCRRADRQLLPGSRLLLCSLPGRQLHVCSRPGEEAPTLLDGCTVSAAQQAAHLQLFEDYHLQVVHRLEDA